MLQAFIVSAILLIIGILILGFRIFFIKNGEFPNIHIGGNQGLKKQGISCATTQVRDEQKSKNLINKEVYNEITQF
jgi:hypothetical protein